MYFSVNTSYKFFMQLTGKRVLAAVLSGCMLASNVPLETRAVQQVSTGTSLVAAFTQAAVGHESMLTLTTDSNFNGEKAVEISDYMPKQEYVQEGLMLWLDGIDNAGEGIHDSQSGYWTDLTDNTQVIINRENKEETEGTNTFTDTAFQLNNSKVYLPDKVAQTINGDAYTVEFVIDSEGYSGNEKAYSPLMTVDETADSWSIFVRTPGQIMELKQGANSLRLQTDFANVYDTTSAVTFQKNQESAWYANGQKKNTFISGNTAQAQNVILGGRLMDNNGKISASYVTSASYHAIRVYNRALSETELRQNAAYDQMRYYGKEAEAPDVKIKGTALSGEGTTTITAEFENGVAEIPVESMEEGTVPMKITVDGMCCNAELVTEGVVELAVEAVPDSIHLVEVSGTATASVIRALIKEQVESTLQDSFFIQEGGSITVSGTENPYGVEFTLGEKTKTKQVEVTIEYAASTDMDILKNTMAKILQGEFSFSSEQEVTAETLKQQISEKLEEDIVADVVWDDGRKYYELTLSKGDENLTSPLYVNSEVVISDFTEEFLQNCTMRKTGTTIIDARDGAICVQAKDSMTYENVVLPIFNYGRDYMLSVDLKVTNAVDTTRWAAMSYGVIRNSEQGDNCWTFWQMAVRRNATVSNGVECATMKSDGTWSVPVTASYAESLAPEKTYNLKIVVKGNWVYEYINDQLMVKYNAQEQMKYGKVAFTFDRITGEYSNLMVTSEIPEELGTEFPKVENGYETDIYEPDTSLVMAPAVISENDGKTVTELISGERRPSTVIRTVSENMTVMDDNQEIALADYVERADKKVLAGFRIETMDMANEFAAYVKENNLVDIMVVSNDPEILLAACNRMAGVHGMLDCDGYKENTTVNIIDLVSKTNESNSRILVLPQQFATEENIQYIQARAISVWVKTEKEQVINAILNGADGILTNDFENAYDVIESFDEETAVLTRNTVITAHRGFHVTAPENTERAAKLAVEAGADAIECDVLLTKDGEVVINHDDTTGRLMDKDLVVADSTLEELQQLTFNDNAEEGDKIPTLRELFLAADEADPDDDIIHVIEIKTSDTNVIEPMVKIIKEMNMEDRVVFISFYDYQLELIRQAMPNIAVGELNSVCSATDDVATAMKKLCDRMDGYGYFYNCYYGSQSTEILQAARFRGIYVHPWTVNSLNEFENEYFNNYHGITTDRADFATDYANKVTTENETYTFRANDEKGVVINTKAYTRAGNEIQSANIFMKQISGTPVIWNSETKTCYADASGEAVVLFGITYHLEETDKTYTVYSTPVTLEITLSQPDISVTPSPSSTPPATPIPTQTLQKSQSITTKNITKTYGAKPFSVGAKTNGNGELTYTTSDKKVVTVSKDGRAVIKGCGKATITITAAETKEYKVAEKKITITVKPKKQTISSLKSAKAKTITVKWKKDTKATGYILQYSTDKSFKKKVKSITISKNSTTSKKISKLTTGKKYYVRVCSYKKVSLTKLKGSYSAVKAVQVKK